MTLPAKKKGRVNATYVASRLAAERSGWAVENW
jgi:hypothetical protein